MKKITILVIVLTLTLLIVGCTKGYNTASYYPTQPVSQNPNQGYYGGGCTISQANDISESPVENIDRISIENL